VGGLEKERRDEQKGARDGRDVVGRGVIRCKEKGGFWYQLTHDTCCDDFSTNLGPGLVPTIGKGLTGGAGSTKMLSL